MCYLWFLLLELALVSCVQQSRMKPSPSLRMSVSNEILSTLGNYGSTYCALNGMLYSATSEANCMLLEPAPTALLPTPYPKDMYQYAKLLQPIINELIDKISRDRVFLRENLDNVAMNDEFTQRLLNIYNSLSDTQVTSSIQLGIHRSDYMLNYDKAGDTQLLQVEINTIASSFGCLSAKMSEYHRFMLKKMEVMNLPSSLVDGILSLSNLHETGVDAVAVGADSTEQSQQALSATALSLQALSANIPDNLSTRLLGFALAMGHLVYGRGSESVVLFIVQEGERNIADQKLLEQELYASHGIHVERRTLKELSMCAHYKNKKELYISANDGRPDLHVSVAYYRAGYTPTDYPSESEWQARQLIEESEAIKCPSVGYQLAGTKKIQQVLTQKGVLERYLTSEQCSILRQCFAKQYSLSNIESDGDTKNAVDDAVRDGSQWVLKPQREGGGNNYYNRDVSDFILANTANSVLNSYVLMQRIFPQEKKSLLLRKGRLLPCNTISELGIYGTFIGGGNWEEIKPIINIEAGYLLRTKPYDSDEGGVASGYSVLNSVVLTGEGRREWEDVEIPTEEASPSRDYDDQQEIQKIINMSTK